jgi:osmotically-inducible protein OsmY
MKRSAPAIILILLLLCGVVLYFYGRPLLGAVRGVTQRASDVATTTKVRSAFSLSKRLSAYEIQIDARGGVVTLTGQVPSEIDRELATSVARDVPNVTNVDNQLVIQPGLTPSEASVREGRRVADLEIRADLLDRLRQSPELAGQNIQIEVRDRVVTLGGQVATPAQKSGADQLARAVSNVAEVVNNLAVSDPSAGQSETPGFPDAAARDKALGDQISFALFRERDNFANVGSIRVEARDGVVTLSGAVASRAERALSERIVREVEGVRSVNNQLVAP